MRLRIARKIRDAWMDHWHTAQIVRRFTPEAQAERDALASVLRSSSPTSPAPLTKEERKLLGRMQRHAPRHRAQTTLRAVRRLNGEERADWMVEWALWTTQVKLDAMTPWERAMHTANVMPAAMVDIVTNKAAAAANS